MGSSWLYPQQERLRPVIDMDCEETFFVRIWGVRGSYPVPGKTTTRYGGNTPCIELQVGKHMIIIDAGTGIINLGHELLRRSQQHGNAPIVATILLTHLHHDHTHGFPFFAPVHMGESMLNVFGPHLFEDKLEDELNNVVLTLNFPLNLNEMPSFKIIHSLRPNEMILFGPGESDIDIRNMYLDPIKQTPDIVKVSILKGYAHPKNGVYIYRVDWRGKSMVFASDTEGYRGNDQRLITFAKDTDVLIHDAQYTTAEYMDGKQGWGHSTIDMACEVAQRSGAKRLLLYHHDPGHSDEQIDAMEREAQTKCPQAIAAYEGMEIQLI
jgi:phosphoribosyl 1,2-cyclic phosphodiesterase